MRLGGELSQFAIERQEQEIATDLLADKVAYEDALRQFESEYKETHKGLDARSAEEDYSQFHKKQQEALEAKWQGNPYALRASAYMVANLRTPSMNRAIAYRDIEDQEYLRSNLEASRKQALQKFSDPFLSPTEKLKALESEEINLRTFAGQRLQTVDGKKQWVSPMFLSLIPFRMS